MRFENTLALEVYNQLASYAAGTISLREFQDWFDPLFWDTLGAPNDPETRDLCAEIGLRLAEYSNGHWTEAELKTTLARMTRVVALRRPWVGAHTWLTASSSNKTSFVGPFTSLADVREYSASGRRSSRESV
jgi:hypothetical protein